LATSTTLAPPAHSTAWSTLGPLLRLTWPVMIEQLLHFCVGISDKLLAGRFFTDSHLAAATTMSYLMWLLTELFVFVAAGSTALIARSTGAGDLAMARRVANQSFVLGAICAVPAVLIGLFFAEAIVSLTQLQAEAAPLAVRYWLYVIVAIPCVMAETVGIACLRGAGDTRAGLWIMGLVNLVNIGLSWALAQGWGPLPELGWDGIALGTSLAHVAGGLLVGFYFLRNRSGLGFAWSALRIDSALQARILRIGIPGGLDITAVILCQCWFVAIVNSISVQAAAAHGVAIQIEGLAYLPGAAFQVAVATLTGQYLGAREPNRAWQVIWQGCLLGEAVMLSAGLVLFFGGEFVAGLMVRSESQTVIELSGVLLRIVSLSMPALALLIVLNGALRGAGDTRSPLWINLCGFLLVRIPLAYLFVNVWGWGVTEAWYAMVADLFVRCALVVIQFRRGLWQHALV